MTHALIQRLIEAGTPADLIADIAMELAKGCAQNEAIEARRTKDRERQQRKRDREANHVTSRDITLDSVTTRDNADLPLPSSFPPIPLSPLASPLSPLTPLSPSNPPVLVGANPEKKVEVVLLPDWMPSDDWKDYLEMRKKIKKNPTDRAKQLVINKLGELRKSGNDPGEVLRRSIMNNWQDIYEIKREYQNGNSNKSADAHSNFTAGIALALSEDSNPPGH